jgi:hypothetical protein
MYAACHVHDKCFKYRQVCRFTSIQEGLAFLAAWAVSASRLEVGKHKAFDPSAIEVSDMLAHVPAG